MESGYEFSLLNELPPLPQEFDPMEYSRHYSSAFTSLESLAPFPPSDFTPTAFTFSDNEDYLQLQLQQQHGGDSFFIDTPLSRHHPAQSTRFEMLFHGDVATPFLHLPNLHCVEQAAMQTTKPFPCLSPPVASHDEKRCRLDSQVKSTFTISPSPSNPGSPAKASHTTDGADRRKKISDKIRSLEKLMPWEKKMSLAMILEETHKYIRFLHSQIAALHWMPLESVYCTAGEVGETNRLKSPTRQQILEVLANSPGARTNETGACSSSLGFAEKSSAKAAIAASDVRNMCRSPSPVSSILLEQFLINIEDLDNTSMERFGCLLNDLLGTDDPDLGDSSSVQLTVMNRLLAWKSDILKAMEMTESELEGGRHCLVVGPSSYLCEGDGNVPKKQEASYILGPKAAALFVAETQVNASVHQAVSAEVTHKEINASAFANQDTIELSSADDSMASNMPAKYACEPYFTVPRDLSSYDDSRFPGICQRQFDSHVKEKITDRIQLLRAREKILLLQFKAFQLSRKKDLHQLDLAKYQSKSSKKAKVYPSAKNSGHLKLPQPVRLRFSSSPPRRDSVVPTTELVNYMEKLLPVTQLKPLRDTLRMPAMILNEKERVMSRFIPSNGLIEDPYDVEKERTIINPWTSEEKEIFLDMLATHGKNFKKIAHGSEPGSISRELELRSSGPQAMDVERPVTVTSAYDMAKLNAKAREKREKRLSTFPHKALWSLVVDPGRNVSVDPGPGNLLEITEISFVHGESTAFEAPEFQLYLGINRTRDEFLIGFLSSQRRQLPLQTPLYLHEAFTLEHSGYVSVRFSGHRYSHHEPPQQPLVAEPDSVWPIPIDLAAEVLSNLSNAKVARVESVCRYLSMAGHKPTAYKDIYFYNQFNGDDLTALVCMRRARGLIRSLTICFTYRMLQQYILYTSAFLQPLSYFGDRLEKLNLAGLPHIGPDDLLPVLANCCSMLTDLEICFLDRISLVFVLETTTLHCKGLNRFIYRGEPEYLTPEIPQNIWNDFVSTCPVTDLGLCGVRVSDNQVLSILQVSKLRKLDLSQSRGFTGNFLSGLGVDTSILQELILEKCVDLEEYPLQQFITRLVREADFFPNLHDLIVIGDGLGNLSLNFRRWLDLDGLDDSRPMLFAAILCQMDEQLFDLEYDDEEANDEEAAIEDGDEEAAIEDGDEEAAIEDGDEEAAIEDGDEEAMDLDQFHVLPGGVGVLRRRRFIHW